MKYLTDQANRYILSRLLAGMCGGILLLLLFFPASSPAAGLKVKGTIYSVSGKPAEKTTVVLQKIVMAQKPTITPVGKTLTDGEGRFEFSVAPFEDHVFFRVSAGFGAKMTGSDPFRLTPENPVKTVRLILPKILMGLSHILFRKELVVVEPLERALQITEAIYLINRTDSVVETGDSPFIKQIPKEAVNFQLFDRQGRVRADRVNDKIHFQMSIPPGEHQLLFSYDLPVDDRSYDFRAFLPHGTSEFEMLTPVNSLALSLAEEPDLSRTRIVSQEKQFDTRRYQSTSLFLNEGLQVVHINVAGIPFSQKRFYYPALVLAASLIFGLFVFLSRKPALMSNVCL